MIGKWVSVNISKDARPTVYTIMLHLLRPDEHLAVRLAAAQNLKACIDDWDFEPATFAPYLEQSVQGLKSVMSQVEEPDSRMRILSCMSIIVERMDEHIAPYAQQIIELLPPLWQAAANQNLLQSAILVIMTKLVESLKSQSVGLHALVMPLIRLSVDPSQEAHVYLMEDGFELWLATLKSAREATEELLSLVPAAVALLSEGMDHMRTMLKILQSYLMLDAERTFQVNAMPTFEAMVQLRGGKISMLMSNNVSAFIKWLLGIWTRANQCYRRPFGRGTSFGSECCNYAVHGHCSAYMSRPYHWRALYFLRTFEQGAECHHGQEGHQCGVDTVPVLLGKTCR